MKKYLIAGCMLLGYLMPVHSMQHVTSLFTKKEPIVREPYTPNRAVRHQRLISAATALSFIVACTPLVEESVLGRVLAQGVCLVGMGALCASEKTFLDKLLIAPEKALHDAVIMHRYLRKKIKQEKIKERILERAGLECYTQLVDAYSNRSPVFLLSECCYQKVGSATLPCIFSRLEDSSMRAVLESTVVQDLIEESNEGTVPVEAVSFASGGLFSDLVTIARFFARHPHAALTWRAIDTEYGPFVRGREVVGIFPELTGDGSFTGDVHGLLVRGLREDPDLLMYALKIEKRGNQLVNYIHTTFPEARFSLVLYAHAQHYFQHKQERSLPAPAVVLSADMQDDASLAQESVAQYAQLVLGCTPSKNRWLAINDQGRYVISSLTTQPSTAEEECFEVAGQEFYREEKLI